MFFTDHARNSICAPLHFCMPHCSLWGDTRNLPLPPLSLPSLSPLSLSLLSPLSLSSLFLLSLSPLSPLSSLLSEGGQLHFRARFYPADPMVLHPSSRYANHLCMQGATTFKVMSLRCYHEEGKKLWWNSEGKQWNHEEITYVVRRISLRICHLSGGYHVATIRAVVAQQFRMLPAGMYLPDDLLR